MHDPGRLKEKMERLRGQIWDVEPAGVSGILVETLAIMSGDPGSREAALLNEIGLLGRAVADARAEIAALKVDDITQSYIPGATDELDAIVEHTAAATESILEVCETLDCLGGELVGDASCRLQTATMKIYEACTFQDITGQRITKVVSALKMIETSIARIVQRFGLPGVLTEPLDAARPAGLLNGPQLPAAAMDQADIDKLLASFD